MINTSPESTASSVKVATVKTTPSRPSTAKVIEWASLATNTAALDASLSRIHSTPVWSECCYLMHWGIDQVMKCNIILALYICITYIKSSKSYPFISSLSKACIVSLAQQDFRPFYKKIKNKNKLQHSMWLPLALLLNIPATAARLSSLVSWTCSV